MKLTSNEIPVAGYPCLKFNINGVIHYDEINNLFVSTLVHYGNFCLYYFELVNVVEYQLD